MKYNPVWGSLNISPHVESVNMDVSWHTCPPWFGTCAPYFLLPWAGFFRMLRANLRSNNNAKITHRIPGGGFEITGGADLLSFGEGFELHRGREHWQVRGWGRERTETAHTRTWVLLLWMSEGKHHQTMKSDIRAASNAVMSKTQTSPKVQWRKTHHVTSAGGCAKQL